MFYVMYFLIRCTSYSLGLGLEFRVGVCLGLVLALTLGLDVGLCADLDSSTQYFICTQ